MEDSESRYDDVVSPSNPWLALVAPPAPSLLPPSPPPADCVVRPFSPFNRQSNTHGGVCFRIWILVVGALALAAVIAGPALRIWLLAGVGAVLLVVVVVFAFAMSNCSGIRVRVDVGGGGPGSTAVGQLSSVVFSAASNELRIVRSLDLSEEIVTVPLNSVRTPVWIIEDIHANNGGGYFVDFCCRIRDAQFIWINLGAIQPQAGTMTPTFLSAGDGRNEGHFRLLREMEQGICESLRFVRDADEPLRMRVARVEIDWLAVSPLLRNQPSDQVLIRLVESAV